MNLGADVNAVDANGETAMHGAAYKNLPKVVGAHVRMLLLCEICDWSKFKNRRPVFGYAGRCPGVSLRIRCGVRSGADHPLPDADDLHRVNPVADDLCLATRQNQRHAIPGADAPRRVQPRNRGHVAGASALPRAKRRAAVHAMPAVCSPHRAAR